MSEETNNVMHARGFQDDASLLVRSERLKEEERKSKIGMLVQSIQDAGPSFEAHVLSRLPGVRAKSTRFLRSTNTPLHFNGLIIAPRPEAGRVDCDSTTLLQNIHCAL